MHPLPSYFVVASQKRCLRWCGAGGNPESNTLISDMATVICLDDYHSLDRTGRKEKGVTALDPKAQNFEMMYEQAKAIKDGKPIDKPIYNHVTGILDPAETIKPPKVWLLFATTIYFSAYQNCTRHGVRLMYDMHVCFVGGLP